MRSLHHPRDDMTICVCVCARASHILLSIKIIRCRVLRTINSASAAHSARLFRCCNCWLNRATHIKEIDERNAPRDTNWKEAGREAEPHFFLTSTVNGRFPLLLIVEIEKKTKTGKFLQFRWMNVSLRLSYHISRSVSTRSAHCDAYTHLRASFNCQPSASFCCCCENDIHCVCVVCCKAFVLRFGRF